ncbi:molybdopterin converting factor subunit 1 [Paenibacillus chartarius]|uniref:Molybdopterin converting factor subunit 1 n=1 Tax=Paenibacillus chartarius TaxID=747481 RepID=A0ABV6DN13_9BACL
MSNEYQVQLFAGLAEAAGAPVVRLASEREKVTVAELKAMLAEAYPQAAAILRTSFVAVNQSYAPPEDIVSVTDEIAVIPPVSGGEPAAEGQLQEDDASLYRLTYEPIQSESVLQQVLDPNHGASLLFVGTTREWTKGQRTVKLDYEAYEPMALKTMEQIGNEIGQRWPGTRTAITHRLGTVQIGEASVAIAVSAPHRGDCYEASRYAIERLKQIVPIWKKEIWEDGSEWKGHQQGPWNPTATPHS